MKFIFLEKSKTPSLDSVVIDKNSVVLLSTGFLPTLNLDDELLGVTNYVKSLCVKSFQFSCTILVGTPILCKGKRYFGTLVVDQGKFIGISDMTHPLSDTFDKSGVLRVFDTSRGRLGVISGDDIFFPEVTRLLRLWECDILLFCSKDKTTRKHRVLSEAQGIANGLTAVLFDTKTMRFFNAKKIAKKCANVVEIEKKCQDFLLEKRRPEMYSPIVKKPF